MAPAGSISRYACSDWLQGDWKGVGGALSSASIWRPIRAVCYAVVELSLLETTQGEATFRREMIPKPVSAVVVDQLLRHCQGGLPFATAAQDGDGRAQRLAIAGKPFQGPSHQCFGLRVGVQSELGVSAAHVSPPVAGIVRDQPLPEGESCISIVGPLLHLQPDGQEPFVCGKPRQSAMQDCNGCLDLAKREQILRGSSVAMPGIRVVADQRVGLFKRSLPIPP